MPSLRRFVWNVLVALVSLGCDSPGDGSPGDVSPGDVSPGDVSPGDVSPGDVSPGGGGAAGSAGGSAEDATGKVEGSDSCGDFVCAVGEDCASCAADCGGCWVPLTLWRTEPTTDAGVALTEGRMGALEGALLRDIGAAETAIWLAMYGLSRDRVKAELARALARGVEVRILTECENRVGRQADLLGELESLGARVKDDRSSFGGLAPGCPEDGGAMHHKFVIIDRRLVWAGSANLTPTDLNYNDNHAFRIESVAVAAHFLGEWDALWSGQFGIEKPGWDALALQVGDSRLEIGFSPRRAGDGGSVSRTLVLQALRGARASVAFAAFSFTDEAVSAALWAGPFSVRGIVDATSASQASSRVRELCDHGVEVVVENLPGKVHHKLAVVDAKGEGGVVVGGSANWSEGGFDRNDETVLAVHDGELSARAAAEIERLISDPAHGGAACCFHSAEAFSQLSPLCNGVPCVCRNGLDDDFDGRVDEEDSGCASPFACPG